MYITYISRAFSYYSVFFQLFSIYFSLVYTFWCFGICNIIIYCIMGNVVPCLVLFVDGYSKCAFWKFCFFLIIISSFAFHVLTKWKVLHVFFGISQHETTPPLSTAWIYLNYKHVLGSPLKVHHPFSLVDTQTLLLCTHCISAIQYNEDVCICAGSKQITCEGFDLIRYNCRTKSQVGLIMCMKY